jgi:hypothetical protein
MTPRGGPTGVVLGILLSTAVLASDSERSRTEQPPRPLEELRTTPIGDGFFGWADPALCDDAENTYFLTVTPWGPDTKEQPMPRDVLKIPPDGKRTTVSPANSPKLSAAKLASTGAAIDAGGRIWLLVWATWKGQPGEEDKRAQYLVTFNEKGEYRSEIEVDSKEILISRFDVFDSGELLLLGRRGGLAESRVTVLSPSGKELRDVTAELAGQPIDDGAKPPPMERMARGGDGRIYVTHDQGDKGILVTAISPSGQSERVLAMQSGPERASLDGWRAAGDRFAAAYKSAQEGQSSRWWIVVHRTLSGSADDQQVYGPAPGPLLCYSHRESGERFTFYVDGKLVTMSGR